MPEAMPLTTIGHNILYWEMSRVTRPKAKAVKPKMANPTAMIHLLSKRLVATAITGMMRTAPKPRGQRLSRRRRRCSP